MTPGDLTERDRRWRLLLGADTQEAWACELSASDLTMDQALAALYEVSSESERGGKRRGGLEASSPRVARWLGDIRQYFPTSVVRVLQQDAMDRLNLRQMLLEPELLAHVEPDVHLVANLLSLSGVMPQKSKETARLVVGRCVAEIERRLAEPMRQAVVGALNRTARERRPRHHEIDWHRTIRANLKHYQPEYQTIIPEKRIGFGHKRAALRDVILCVDQSGSMASSVVYSGIFAAVLASLPAMRTSVVVFDTSVIDLSDKLSDPVELLFGTQLGGGTDIHQALSYCQGLMRQPTDTIFLLISDLIEGGVRDNLIKRAAGIIASGAMLITLLALSDDGAPAYDHENAALLAALGSPAFACTPELFPDLIAAAIQRRDIAAWAAGHGIVTARRG